MSSLFKNLEIVLFCILAQVGIYMLAQLNAVTSPDWAKDVKYISFPAFWWKVNILDFGRELSYGMLLLASVYWLLELVLVLNVPAAARGVRKYLKGKHAGQERLSDLVRATVTVDEDKPDSILTVLQAISGDPAFRLIRVKDKLAKLKHVNANFLFRGKCVCEIQIRLGAPPPFYHANHFLYEVERMQQLFEVVETLNSKAIWLANHGMLRGPEEHE